jgi:type VI secretion system secreted protein VgrG
MEIGILEMINFLKSGKASRKFQDIIIEEAYKAKRQTGLPASVVSAQAIIETGWGKHIPIDIDSGKYSYNLFGIKGFGTNGYVECYTHEYINDERVRIIDKFRAYHNYEESFVDYGNLILNNPRYQKAVAGKDDPRKYIQELWKAGYCTDPEYPKKVIQIAEQCGYLRKM